MEEPKDFNEKIPYGIVKSLKNEKYN